MAVEDKMKRIKLNITGMHCVSCKKLIEMELSGKISKINWIRIDNEKNIAEIEFDEEKILEEEIEKGIKKLGYGVKK